MNLLTTATARRSIVVGVVAFGTPLIVTIALGLANARGGDVELTVIFLACAIAGLVCGLIGRHRDALVGLLGISLAAVILVGDNWFGIAVLLGLPFVSLFLMAKGALGLARGDERPLIHGVSVGAGLLVAAAWAFIIASIEARLQGP